MPLHISHRLSRLIRERGYTAGAIMDAERRLAVAIDQMRAAEAHLDGLRRRLAELDEELSKDSIEPTDIRTVRLNPQRPNTSYGVLMAGVVRILRDADGAVTTNSIMDHFIAHHGYPAATAQERKTTRQRVLRPVNKLKAKGVVIRLPSQRSSKGQPEGRWLWVGL